MPHLIGIYVTIFISITGTACAAAAPEKTRQDLIDIERRIGVANLNCDYKYFALIEAPEFTFTAPDGSITSREQDLAGESTCKNPPPPTTSMRRKSA